MSAPRPRRIGLYGGSFDPVHVCHVLAATWALCRGDLDELRLVPTFAHPFGKAMAPFDTRCRMLEAATAHLGPTARVDRLEERLGGVSYTVRTVEALLAEAPGATVVLLTGTDAWASREKWHAWPRLRDLVEPLVLGREGVPDPPAPPVPVHLPDISSTDVRERVRTGQPVGHLVPAPALAILRAEGLYR